MGRRHQSLVKTRRGSNAKQFGFQIRGDKGERLLQTAPIDGTGCKRVEFDPTAGGMKPACAQQDRDGMADLPIKAVHLICIAKAAGATSLVLDGPQQRAFLDDGTLLRVVSGWRQKVSMAPASRPLPWGVTPRMSRRAGPSNCQAYSSSMLVWASASVPWAIRRKSMAPLR
jgi:hypothetical protein